MIEKTFATPSGDVHYWVSSPVDTMRPWMVFLPGLTADHTLFDAQLAAFRERANCLTWDAPAHGESRPFALDFTMDSLADMMRAILQKEAHAEQEKRSPAESAMQPDAENATAFPTEEAARPIIVGQSLGGYIAQAYIDLHPGEVRGFVSIDSAPLQRRYMTGAEMWMLKHTKLMYLSIPWKFLLWWGPQGTAQTDVGRANMRAMMEKFAKREYCELAAYGFRMLAQAVEQDRAYRIDCPVLLLCGEHDQAGSAKRYNVSWNRIAGLPLLWVPGAGHNSNVDNPAFVNAQIESLLAECDCEDGR